MLRLKAQGTTVLLLVTALLAIIGLAPSAALAQPTQVWYIVRAGDTLTDIAARYQTTPQAILAANGLSGSVLRPGQSLAVPLAQGAELAYGSHRLPLSADGCVQGASYVLRQGDTLALLAARWGTTVAALKGLNGLVGNVVWAGQALKMACAAANVAGSAAAGAPARATTACGSTYIVRAGDSLAAIALRCDLTVAELKMANGLVSNGLLVGQSLRLPPIGAASGAP